MSSRTTSEGKRVPNRVAKQQQKLNGYALDENLSYVLVPKTLPKDVPAVLHGVTGYKNRGYTVITDDPETTGSEDLVLMACDRKKVEARMEQERLRGVGRVQHKTFRETEEVMAPMDGNSVLAQLPSQADVDERLDAVDKVLNAHPKFADKIEAIASQDD